MRQALAAALLAASLVPFDAARAQAGSAPPVVAIDWSMPDRFGPDGDGDGLIDFPNTTAYVHNRESGCEPCPVARFRVRLEATVTAGLPVNVFSWRVQGASLSQELRFDRTVSDLDLLVPEGVYRVEVAARVVLAWGAVTVRTEREVAVSDLLVVALGDSYASGEGNPEVRRLGPGVAAVWGDGGDAAAGAAHAGAHRSTAAWPARTALALELLDPRTSVTFVSTAASGARIDRGILTAQEPGGESQLDQVIRLIGDRQVDVLLIQEGGNSVGFSRLVRALVSADPLFDPVCYELLVDQALAAVRDGDWGRGTRLRFGLPFDWSCVPTVGSRGPFLPGLDGLPDAIDRLAAAVSAFHPGRVVLVGYPDPTGAGSDGRRCREIVGDVTPPIRLHEISREEGRLGVSEVLQPLNRTLSDAAARHGWTFVGGVAEAFADGHGYCAPWPVYPGAPVPDLAGLEVSLLDLPDRWYRNPAHRQGASQVGGSGVTWYRTAAQSAVLQGPTAPYATSGTMHPNEIGHAVIARLVLAELSGD